MQYAHLYTAYVNSNELAPLETNVIKSHDLELRQDCRGIIPHHFPQKNMRRPCSRTSRCPQNIHKVSSQPNRSPCSVNGPLVACHYTPLP